MKFMVCYNGSAAAKEALMLAQQHAKVWDAKVDVIETITRDTPLKHSFIEETEGKLNQDVGKIMEGSDVSFAAQLLIGSLSAGEALVQFAQEEQMDQIFIGIEKKSKVDKLIFGSTAQYVILQAPCPVVTVKKYPGKKQ
jgi:nucleotide-binding universal stress UspA family protein